MNCTGDTPTMTNTVKKSTTQHPAAKQPSIIGLDLAKSVIHLYALDEQGNTLWEKTLKTDNLVTFLSVLKPCLIDIAACRGSHY